MPMSDAYMEATCDKCGCTEVIELEYRYRSWGGESGYYDDKSVWERLVSDGWEVDEDTDECICPSCIEIGENENGQDGS